MDFGRAEIQAALVSFGDGNSHLRRAARRIGQEGRKSGYFHEVFTYNRRTLWKKYPHLVAELDDLQARYPKGLGLYLWKIHLIRETLSEIDENVILLYLDAGCHLHSKYRAQQMNMQKYFSKADGQSVLAFQIRDYQFQDSTSFHERLWSLSSLLEEFNLPLDHRTSNQVESGVIFIRNDTKGRKFVDDWLHYARKNDYEYIQDVPIIINGREVGHNRHDQSVFSCLYKSRNLVSIPNENYFPNSWNTKGSEYPIWTSRNRTGIGHTFKLRDIPERISIKVENQFHKIISKLMHFARTDLG